MVSFALFLPAATTNAAGQVNSSTIEEAKVFLENYVAYSHSQSPQFYELYSDRAVIRARIEGQNTASSFQGRAYKKWVRELVESQSTALDASIFQDVTLERRGGRLLIRAKRYSMNRCYWDNNYYVGIEREGVQYRIVEEVVTMQPQAHCEVAAIGTAAMNVNSSVSMGMGDPNARQMFNVDMATRVQTPMMMSVPPATLPTPPASITTPVQRPLPPYRIAGTASPQQQLTAEEQVAMALKIAQQLMSKSGGGLNAVQSSAPNTATVQPVAVQVREGRPSADTSNSLRVTPQ
jgi:hypothetical protein